MAEKSPTLGQLALDLRECLGLSQAAFGQLFGYSRDVVGAFERDAYKTKTSRDFYVRQLKALCVGLVTDDNLRALAQDAPDVYSLPIFGHFRVEFSPPSDTQDSSLKIVNPAESHLKEPPAHYGAPVADKIVSAKVDDWGKALREQSDFEVPLSDNSMEPKFPIGSFLRVAPDEPLVANGPCLIRLKGRKPLVRIYLGQPQRSILRLLTLNPETVTEIPSSEVEWAYPIRSVRTEYILHTQGQATA